MTSNTLTESKVSKTLNWVYEKASDGLLNMESAAEMAELYMNKYPDNKLAAANALIRAQNVKSAASGFITGLGGLATMPIAIPMNLASVLYIQVRMVMAVAIIGGHNVKEDKVKAFVFACLAGNKARELLKEAGVQIARNFVLQSLSTDAILRINRMVGFNLIAKLGESGIIRISKAMPILGGAIGATIDGIWTNQTGNMAVKWFVEEYDKALDKQQPKD
ncbi:MAG: EcsC family protein [Fibromonadales bacterium]|nr:EcsC family protein [Fibromonadales bacterium]